MNEKEYDLLMKDLCGRLPYGVKVLYKGWDSDHGCEFNTVEDLIGIDDKFIHTLWRGERDKHSIVEPLSIIDYKPYLRPMSSMTDEEKYQYEKTQWEYQADYCAPEYFDGLESYDWLNAHHFDYRGLIEKGLALEAPKGMYNNKTRKI